jgi:uncharacterized membrane protein
MKMKVLAKLLLFCVTLLIIRIIMTGHFSFVFLLWNLFLAWVPLYFIKKAGSENGQFERGVICALTVLFLPNAPYLVTDLFHLSKNLVAPVWFDTLMIFTFSLFGLILFLQTCELLFKQMRMFCPNDFLYRCSKLLIVLLSGYGIYLGRFLRFNSWDLFTDPVDLFYRMGLSLMGAGHWKETFFISITYAAFLYLILEVFESFRFRILKQVNDLPS